MTRQTIALTATQVERTKPKSKPYRLYDSGGLVLNIAKSGTNRAIALQRFTEQ